MPNPKTIKLINEDGQTKKMNLADYDAAKEKDWRPISSEDSKAVESNGADADDAADDGAGDAAVDPVEDWMKMKWQDARKYVANHTGTFPTSKAHAHELMNPREHGHSESSGKPEADKIN